MTGRAIGGEQWSIRLVALLPVVLVVFGWQVVVGASSTLMILVPAAVVTALLTAGAGRWIGLLGVLASGALGAGFPGNTPSAVMAGVAAAVALCAWTAQVLVATARPALAVIPPMLLLVVELLLGLAGSDGSLLLAAGIAVSLALLLLMVGSWTGGGEGRVAAVAPAGGSIAWSAVAMVAMGVVALVVGVLVEPFLGKPVKVGNVENQPPPPSVIVDVRDPLTEATRWQLDPNEADRELMTLVPPVITDPTSRPIWMSLTRYNGRGWEVPQFYRTVQGTVPPDPAGPPTTAVSRSVRVEVGPGLPGPWVPVPQRVTQVLSNVLVRANYDSGVIAALTSPIGQRFEVRQRLGTATEQQLKAAVPLGRPGEAAQTLPGALPPRMAELANSVAADAGVYAWARLVTLSERLRSSRFTAAPASALTLDGPSRTLKDLDAVLEKGTGFQEQYAAIWALTARSWGVPTRLCIGFAPEIREGGTVVRGPDTSIWAEARLAGIGWVVFQPSPQDRAAGRRAFIPPPLPTAVTSPTPTPAPTATGASPSSTSSGAGGDTGDGLSLPSLGPWVVLPLLLASWVGLVAWLRRRRRERLRTGSPQRRTAGAWQWALAEMASAGIALPPAVSADRVADPTDDATDDLPPAVAQPLRVLARICSPALFAPEATGEGQADSAWAAADEVSAACSSSLTPVRRVRRWLLPGLGGGDSVADAAAGIVSETASGRAPRSS